MSENDDEKKVVPPSVILLSSLPQKGNLFMTHYRFLGLE